MMMNKINRVTVTSASAAEPRKLVVSIVNTHPTVVNALRRTVHTMMKTPTMKNRTVAADSVTYEKNKCYFDADLDGQFNLTVHADDDERSPVNLFGGAIKSLTDRARAFKLELEGLMLRQQQQQQDDEQARVNIVSGGEDMCEHMITVRDEDYTLGSLLTSLIDTIEIKYEVPKPLEREVVFKLMTEVGGAGLYAFVNAIQARVIDELEAFDREWAGMALA